jgi:hypothetical protein
METVSVLLGADAIACIIGDWCGFHKKKEMGYFGGRNDEIWREN